jgi:superfamily II DNA or RNA helicase
LSTLPDDRLCLCPRCQRVPRHDDIRLATGKLIGEGFDHPPLDTLVLAMPVSWRGTLQQYAGRLHREHADKSDVRIIDFVDTGHPALLRMWDKRQRGYQAMAYRVGSDSSGNAGAVPDDRDVFATTSEEHPASMVALATLPLRTATS